MGVITGYNRNDFVSAKSIFSKVMRGLSSFAGLDIIDENEFPVWTMEVLSKLGNGVMMEDEAIVEIKDYKGLLPENFNQLYSAFRCERNVIAKVPKKHLQNTISFENDITYELLCRKNSCDIQCDDTKTIEKIQVKQYFNEFELHYTFDNMQLLRLSPNVKDKCANDCLNHMCTSEYEISLDKSNVYTNFESGNVYMKFYGTPVDEEGYPLIINDINVEKAVEWYLKYMIFLKMWENSDAPDMQSRWQKAEIEYEKWMAEARFYVKLPAFSTMVNSARNKRAINPVSLFSSIDNKRY